MHVELVQVVLMNTITTHMSQHAFRITTILTVYCSALAWSMLVMLLPIVPIRLLINGLAWYLSVILNKQSSHSPWWPSRLDITIYFIFMFRVPKRVNLLRWPTYRSYFRSWGSPTILITQCIVLFIHYLPLHRTLYQKWATFINMVFSSVIMLFINSITSK